ncbi:tail tubular protein B [uncultured phage_Deep-GF0-KM16-C193]|uniref:Tail tubular protein B n=1 Tax=uncultured phage_Deep-GF0-KM16-C193 TaxID=2740799 RepID=A0A1B1IWS5_9CAUD|nr:tail protein [uncultured phage_Deep-GF0-KM16-C193]ANS05737.1 tail tubular protein B [uncultured phage_Deep-GF0-KM16-C193]
MPLIARTIPNLVQGISQQPEILRLSSQATEQINGFSSVVEGLKKRPPATYVAKLTGSSLANSYVHTINRDTSERYIVVLTNGTIAVYDITGTAKTVVSQTNATNYLSSSDPKSDFVCVTVADYTYILNKTKTAAMAATTSAAKIEQAVYSVLQGINSTKYSVTVDATTYNFTSSNTNTESIRDGLFSAMGTISGITLAKIGNSSFSIIKASGTLAVSASDGYGDDASQIVGDTVQNFSDLPAPAINNMVVEVTGDATTSFDNYFVKYDEANDVWDETVAPATKTTIDEDLMPHVLIRTADGNFRFTQVDGSTYTISATDYDVPSWGTRTVGDLDSSPDPSFIGKKINDIFFHKNRLGFIADENVIMSRSGEFFQFFNETVTQTLDTDPVDVASTSKKVAILRHAISFDEDLLLFSDQTQFILTGGQTLTASNVSINTTTEFETSTTSKPIGAGANVFFAFNKGSYTGIREFYIASDTDTKKADDITANVPKYLPSNIFKLASATNENILVALSSNSADQNALYIYQYYVSDRKRLQSAWHKWTFGTSSTDKILNVDFIENTLYIVNERSDGVYLESIDISPAVVDASATYLTYLDRKLQDDTTGVTVSYSAGTDLTTIVLPYTITNTMKVVGRVGGSNTAGQSITTASQSGTNITISGNYSSANLWIGEQYEFSFVFSQQFIQIADSAGSRISVKEGRLQIRNWDVSYNDTGYFTTEVVPVGRDTSTATFTGLITGSGALGTVGLEDGDFKFAVQSENDKLTVSLKNDSHLPSNFINASWQGYYVTSSARI